jgi:hypothetical protein
MRNGIMLGAGILCLSFATFAQGNKDNTPGADQGGKVVHETRNFAGGGGGGNTTIVYHGGPVMLGTPAIYFIWYGTWDGSSQTILTTLAQSIGGSPYFNINKTYYSVANSVSTPVTGAVAYGGSTVDNYSRGKSLTDAAIQGIVSDAITQGRLPKDTNGVYFVLTATDVKETSGFCTQYCGWHTRGTIAGSDIKYSFVGNPATQCPASCAEQTASSPNNNIGADAMASVLSHELEEAVTDPDLNAWYDRRGMENADKCAWTFGTTFTTSNGSKANMTLGGLNFLIQRNWVNSGSGFCALQ